MIVSTLLWSIGMTLMILLRRESLHSFYLLSLMRFCMIYHFYSLWYLHSTMYSTLPFLLIAARLLLINTEYTQGPLTSVTVSRLASRNYHCNGHLLLRLRGLLLDILHRRR